MGHQVLDLLDFSLSIRVNDLRHILHKSEVSTHGISQTGNLTQLWDQGDLKSSPPVFIN